MVSGVLLVLTKNVFLEECKRELIVGIDVLLVLKIFCWEKKEKMMVSNVVLLAPPDAG